MKFFKIILKRNISLSYLLFTFIIVSILTFIFKLNLVDDFLVPLLHQNTYHFLVLIFELGFYTYIYFFKLILWLIEKNKLNNIFVDSIFVISLFNSYINNYEKLYNKLSLFINNIIGVTVLLIVVIFSIYLIFLIDLHHNKLKNILIDNISYAMYIILLFMIFNFIEKDFKLNILYEYYLILFLYYIFLCVIFPMFYLLKGMRSI